MKDKLAWIMDRLGENSTWRGIVGLLTAAGVALKPDQADKIIAAGIAIVGVINIFRTAPPSGKEVADAIKTGDTSIIVKPAVENTKDQTSNTNPPTP